MSRKACVIKCIGYIDAHAWYPVTKWLATLIVSAITTVIGFATAISAGVVAPVAKEFRVSQEVDTLATALFLWGFGIGALVTGPISETCGRNMIFIVTMALFMACIGIAGVADTLPQQLVFRFLAGFLGSSPMVCAGGSISDLWTSHQRVFVFPIFAVISCVGSLLAPVAGGYIQVNNASWRWGDWITLIASGIFLFVVIFFLPETFQPLLHKVKARVIQSQTKGKKVHNLTIDSSGRPSLAYQILQGLYRPFVLTVHEPIVVLFTWYISLIYIVLFTSLNGYTFIFSENYGLNEAQTGLIFLAMLVGSCFVAFLIPYANGLYNRDLLHAQNAAKEYNSKQPTEHAEHKDLDTVTPPPESQLYYALFGAPLIPISLFWMAFTARPDITYWCPLVGSIFFGFGFTTVFVSSYQYLMSCYGIWSASALASVNCLRSILSGGMMMASIPMYKNIGVQWSLTVLGIAGAVMAPVPYAFYVWGPTVRRWSRHAYKG
ncbi:putative MFS transporter [Aspergillus karnatakaensis]|uniref:putative MFS transporter n=1 Tax=Aspergillus karnatakaensis TaxID=1810916 RepID=UPI003CCDE722